MTFAGVSRHVAVRWTSIAEHLETRLKPRH